MVILPTKTIRRFLIKYVLSTTTFLLFLVLCVSNCSQFGTLPKGKDLIRLKNSKQYDYKKRKFVNRRLDIIEVMRKRIDSASITWDWFFGDNNRVPEKKMPEATPDMESFLKQSDRIKFIWLGHSSLLMNFLGQIILLDPIFSKEASPVPFIVRRFQPPVIKLDELPEIDYVVISHDHYDHLDMDTIKYFKNKKTQFLVPLGVGSHLKGWGITKERIYELDWWENIKRGGVTFTATPAQHFSGRSFTKQNKTLWAGWVFEKDSKKIFFSGDTGLDIHFKTIGERLGPFDLVFLDSGQYNVLWREVHLLPHEVPVAYKDLNAKYLMPIHWGMFELAMHPWYEPPQKLKALAKEKGILLLTPKLGQIIEVGKDQKTPSWWESFMGG